VPKTNLVAQCPPSQPGNPRPSDKRSDLEKQWVMYIEEGSIQRATG